MTPATYFRPNQPNVIHEAYDDEVVIVNLDHGSYYSVDKVGADIWILLGHGSSQEDIVDTLARRYDTPQADVTQVVEDFIAELLEEKLIVATDAPVDLFSNGEVSSNGLGSPPSDFEVPVLRTFTDMQDLLMLDPIHEVDDMGWPNAKPDPQNK